MELDVAIDASRLRGVVPLAVYFDATGSPAFANGDYLSPTFAWTFDADGVDPDANYQHATGFVAGHVFAEPGLYRVRLDALDESGAHGISEVMVEALPFEGTTYHVAESGDDSGAGTLEDPFRSFDHALERAAPNVQILLRRGDEFEVRVLPRAEGGGPVRIGAYEDPERPSQERPILHSTEVDDNWFILALDTDDWRIMDLVVESGGYTTGDAGPRYPAAFTFSLTSSNNLVYRTEFRNLGTTVVDLSGDGNTIAECEMHHFGRTAIWSTGEGNSRHAVIGNRAHTIISDHREHVVRFQGVSGAFVAFNDFRATDTKSNVQFRGNTRDVVLLANVLDRANGLNPQNDESEEYVSHVLVEANLFVGRDDPAYENGYPVRQEGLHTAATDVLVRNNVFYNFETALATDDHPLVGASRANSFIHNTVICVSPNCRMVRVCPTCPDISVFSNLQYNASIEEPGIYDAMLEIRNPDISGVASDYNIAYWSGWSEGSARGIVSTMSGLLTLAEWQSASGQDGRSRTVDPGIVSVDPTNENWAAIAASSPAADAATVSGTHLDYRGRLRDSDRDVGAVEAPR